MAEYMGNDEAQSNSVTREYAVANGVTITDGDLVLLDTNGRVNLPTTAGERLLGQVTGGASRTLNRAYSPTVTGDAAGTQTVLVNIELAAKYLQKTDATLTAANVGKSYDLTAGTGAAQQINIAKASPTGQLIVVGLGNGLRGADATYAVVEIAKSQRQT